MAEPQKKAFSWDDFDKQQTAPAAAGGAKKPFLWGDADATPTRSPETLAASKALNAQPTQFERDNAMSPNERQANEFLLGAASGASGLPETQTPLRDAIQQTPPAPTIGQSLKQGLMAATPGAGLISSLWKAGKQVIAPPTVSGEDPSEQRAHGIGSAVGMLAPIMAGEGVSGATEGLGRGIARMAVDEGGQPKPLAKLTLGGERARALAEVADPEGTAYERKARDLMRRGKEQDALDRQAARQAKISPPTPETNTEGVAAPQADVVKVPVPRELSPGEKVGYNASTPRKLVLDNALQGRPGAAEMLRNMGKTPLFVSEGGYAPPREKISFGESRISDPGDLAHSSIPFNNPGVSSPHATLNPIGQTGARPIVSPAHQFESSFGPEHQEVGDLAEWETGSREGVRPKKILVP